MCLRVYLWCGAAQSNCGTELITKKPTPIEPVMMRSEADEACGCVIEVHGFSFEERAVVLARVHRALSASGCWTVGYRRRGRRGLEYSFEVELGAAMTLYCGLVEAGLELTEVSHRALTEMCVLRRHEGGGGRDEPTTARLLKMRLMVGFLDVPDEAAIGEVVSAGGLR